MTSPEQHSVDGVALLPCPFCGASQDVDQDIADTGVFWVRCSECCAEGASADTKEEAIAAWNTRSPLPVSLDGGVQGSSADGQQRNEQQPHALSPADVDLTIRALQSLASKPLYTNPVTYAAWCRDAATMLESLKRERSGPAAVLRDLQALCRFADQYTFEHFARKVSSKVESALSSAVAETDTRES